MHNYFHLLYKLISILQLFLLSLKCNQNFKVPQDTDHIGSNTIVAISKHVYNTRFEAFTAVKIQVEVFWVVMACSAVGCNIVSEDDAAIIFRVN